MKREGGGGREGGRVHPWVVYMYTVHVQYIQEPFSEEIHPRPPPVPTNQMGLVWALDGRGSTIRTEPFMPN